MTSIAEIMKQAADGMAKSVENTRRELAGIRSGKATTSLLDLVKVEAYGSPMALNQVAMVAAPEPRLLTVQPFDKSLAPVIEKAIRDGDLGLNPASQGGIIRVPIPPLNEERRKELVRLVHKLGEEGRVGVRHHRHEALHAIKKVEHVSDDEKRHSEKEVQKLTDDRVSEIDQLITAKEAELMEV